MKTIDDVNPKDRAGAAKVALGLVPPAGLVYAALACQQGAAKYGAYNWRAKKIRLTRYLDAIERHLAALRDGEDIDPESGLPHLAHLIATGCIVADAKEGGQLVDDRPPRGPAAELLRRHATAPQAEASDVRRKDHRAADRGRVPAARLGGRG